MSIRSIIEFMVIFDEYRTREDLVSAFELLLSRYRFDFYGIVRKPKPHADPMSLVLAGRWPEGWPEVYINRKFVLIDPTIRYLGHSQRAFRWRDTITAFRNDPQRRRMERMMVEARRYGLEDGYIFPVHGRGGLLGNMTIGGRVVDLSSVEVSLFDCLAKRLFWRLVELRGSDLLSEINVSVDLDVTRRELEVLHYLVEGKTSVEIGKSLNLSNHTVDWYMNGLQEKLGARNRQHAVAIAFRQGLIS